MGNKITFCGYHLLRHGLASTAAAALLVLVGCGETDTASTTAGGQATARAAPAENRSDGKPDRGSRQASSPVNSLTFSATGDLESALESDGTDLLLTGGCLDRNVIGMSFTRGEVTEKDLFQVRLRTADSVAAGETGTFEVSELGWYNGQFTPEDLPTELNLLVPDAYEGSGTLMLTLHEAGGLNGRMAGTVEGNAKQVDGDNEVMINASFDINLGCSNLSLDGLN